MTAEEAIKELKDRIELGKKEYLKDIPEYIEALNMAIKALEKQIAKKPNIVLHKTTGWNTEEHCPVCKTRVYDSYCSGCGQAIDWSEE